MFFRFSIASRISLSTMLFLSLFMPAIFGQGDVGGPGGPGGGAEVIPKGSDFFTTPAGGQTSQDFGQTPIPPGFFGPDCDGFNGIIQLMGVPLPSLGLTDTIVEPLDDAVLMGVPGQSSLGSTDTIVERLDDAVLPGVGSSAHVEIQMVALSLQSLHPILVMCGGVETPVETFWEVDVQVNGDNPQQIGTMEIRKEHDKGGTFDSTLFVSPVFTFFKRPDFQVVRRLGGPETGPLPALEFHGDRIPWLSDKMDCDVVELGRLVQVPFFNLEVKPTSPNFHAGLTRDPKKDHCKWVLVQEDALLARHGVLAVPTTGPDFDEDGIEDQCDNCPAVPNPFQEDDDLDCVGNVCDLNPQTDFGEACVQPIVAPDPDTFPADSQLSNGAFSTVITGIDVGAAVTLTQNTLLPGSGSPTPSGEPSGERSGLRTINTYYKYGPSPDNPDHHWYEFLYDGTTGAEFVDDKILVHFVDGQRGDGDLTANGEIIDPGGPGIKPPLVLYLPYYRAEAESFTGFAVSNYSPRESNVEYRSFGADGAASDFPENPAGVSLGAGTQSARLGNELFGVDIMAEQRGRVELRSDNYDIGTFFQFGTFDQTELDGSVAIEGQSSQFYIPRVFEGDFRGQPATTFVSINNPNPDPIEVELILRTDAGPAGAARPAGIDTRSIPAQGFLYESVGDLFDPDAAISQGYVEVTVTEGPGAVGFGVVELLELDAVIGIQAQEGSGGVSRAGSDTEELFSAQLASETGVIYTSLNLINTSQTQRNLTLTAIAEEGANLADPVDLSLAPGEQFSRDAGDLFDVTAASLSPQGTVPFVGSLRVVVDGPGVLGDVIFGDPTTLEYAALLPLQRESFRKAVFSQVANVAGFFTGVAVYVPGDTEANLELTVFGADGEIVGEPYTETLAPGTRRSMLVPELVPASAGQAGGYVLICSDELLIAQILYGAVRQGRVTLLSAVPPTVIEN